MHLADRRWEENVAAREAGVVGDAGEADDGGTNRGGGRGGPGGM